jgi:hypothetical protein
LKRRKLALLKSIVAIKERADVTEETDPLIVSLISTKEGACTKLLATQGAHVAFTASQPCCGGLAASLDLDHSGKINRNSNLDHVVLHILTSY